MDNSTLKMIYILSVICGLYLIYFISLCICYCCSKKNNDYDKVEQDLLNNRINYVDIA